MLRSLRFQLPAIFLTGFVIAALVATAISVRFFQSYTRTRAIDELRGESGGIVQLLTQQANATLPEGIRLVGLQRAIGGDRIYFAPYVRNFPLYKTIPNLRFGTVDMEQVLRKGFASFELTRGGTHLLAVATPLKVGSQPFGAIVVAKPTSTLRSRLLTLVWRLAVALGGGLVVATLLSVYLSRRISRPPAGSPTRPTRSPPASATSCCRPFRGRTRSRISPTASARWRCA